MLLREFLHKEKRFSRRLLTTTKFSGGGLYVNDQEVTVRYVLQKGDNVTVKLPKEVKGDRMVPEQMALTILYEDEHVLVVDKRPNMSVIPSSDHPNGTLANAILYYYDQIGISNTVHFVNRLDRDTSGALLIAKDRFTHHLFSLAQQENLIHRQYTAIAEGVIIPDSGTINEPIARKEGSIIERIVHPNGQRAVTHFKVEDRSDGHTLLSLKLETGRTHQIRVHLASLGHPLLGDSLYGGNDKQINRQALHSTMLTFIHPFLEKQVEVCSPLPPDFKDVLNRSHD
ncbi:RluA family pseudouridine synthase [Bacillus solimangrovi]|uniref:Pseudouridine synthase n=1 Tax=Bacillus solimangrovi TaxID=1305675 RepID=A0A1E5LC91_9BACI|nr:RluA family pseudouridine synthase [Bacillus solimangrovi]OEH91681.1 RNA pseudouridine synthase [Bacillus solimangrovi]